MTTAHLDISPSCGRCSTPARWHATGPTASSSSPGVWDSSAPYRHSSDGRRTYISIFHLSSLFLCSHLLFSLNMKNERHTRVARILAFNWCAQNLFPARHKSIDFACRYAKRFLFPPLFWWWGIIDGQPFNLTEQVLTFFWAKKPRRFDLVAIYPIDK